MNPAYSIFGIRRAVYRATMKNWRELSRLIWRGAFATIRTNDVSNVLSQRRRVGISRDEQQWRWLVGLAVQFKREQTEKTTNVNVVNNEYPSVSSMLPSFNFVYSFSPGWSELCCNIYALFTRSCANGTCVMCDSILKLIMSSSVTTSQDPDDPHDPWTWKQCVQKNFAKCPFLIFFYLVISKFF